MNDLERELRDLLERKAREGAVRPIPPRSVTTRARRRQVGTVAAATLISVGLVIAFVAGLRTFTGAEPPETRPAGPPMLPDGPDGFRSAALPFASIAYPEGWYLLDTSPLEPYGVARPYLVPNGPVLQLANFDPDLPRSPRCMVDPDSLPPDGVLLTVGIMTPEELAITERSTAPWPAELSPMPSNMDPVCTGGPRPMLATWTAPNGLIYWANAERGAEASPSDIGAMEQAFQSLAFPPTDQPQMSQMAAFQGQGTPRVILGTERLGSGVVELVAYVELNKSLVVGVSGSRGGDCCAGSAVAPGSGSSPEPITTTTIVSPGGTLVYGVISPAIAEVELRTSDGDALPVTVSSLPPSMGYEDRVVWGIAPGADDRATIVGYDADGNIIGNPVFPTGPRTTIATGTDPEGGPWELYLDQTSDGTGLGFGFRNGGSGGGCCLGPLEGDFRLNGFGSGTGEPSDITALASDAVARVVFETSSSGTAIEGQLFPVPDESLGIPQIALVLVPAGVALEGDLVAFDASGNEVGRETITQSHEEPEGPTPEIDAVWQMLRTARDTITLWASGHDGSLENLTSDGASTMGPDIAWNTSDQGKTVPGEVSLRGLAPAGGSELTGLSGWTVVLVSVTPDLANTYCIAVNIDEGGGGNFRYGTQDAADYQECRGGW